jgi:hypothetical protein
MKRLEQELSITMRDVKQKQGFQTLAKKKYLKLFAKTLSKHLSIND